MKVDPTNIRKFRKAFAEQQEDCYGMDGGVWDEHLDRIHDEAREEHWLDVYRMLGEIGMDELALILTGGERIKIDYTKE